MNTAIEIMGNNSQVIATGLIRLLADEFVLSAKTKNAHWNIDAKFYNKHKYFEFQFGQLDEIIYKVAERIRASGHYVPFSLKQFLELTHLAEVMGDKNDNLTYIKELLTDHESMVIHLNEYIFSFENDYHDFESSEFIAGLLEEHENMARFLRSYLK